METIAPNYGSSTKKRGEILRLQQLMRAKKIKAVDLSELTDVSKRTIENTIWKNEEIGGRLLRGLHDKLGVSLDWLLSGNGEMFVNTSVVNEPPGQYPPNLGDDDNRTPLIEGYDHYDKESLQDFWWLTAGVVERSLLQSGAVPDVDYTRHDLFKLAQPFVLSKFNDGALKIE